MRLARLSTWALLFGLFGCDADPSPDAGFPLDVPIADGEVPAPTVYYIVRHTERDAGTDPPINDEGRDRAVRLADALDEAGIDEIIVTHFLRNRESAEPLAERIGAPITEAPPRMSTWPEFGEEVAHWQLGREWPGATFLMVGHSGGYNNRLLRELGVTETIRERYQDLVVVTRQIGEPTRWAILEYGGPSSLDPG